MSLRACSKICLVSVFPEGRREESRRMYAILDEQSNRSFVTSEFFSIFNVACSPLQYTLRICSGLKKTGGRKARGYIVESTDEKVSFRLPTLLE